MNVYLFNLYKYAYKTTNGRKPVEIHNLSLKPNNFVGTTYV